MNTLLDLKPDLRSEIKDVCVSVFWTLETLQVLLRREARGSCYLFGVAI
jgi:hypothetical protein